jgi:IS30 family transposase
VLSVEDEAGIARVSPPHVAAAGDDCFDALQPTLPHLSRSALHRCLQRHSTSRLPEVGGDKPAKKRFKRHPIGYFHIDLAEVRTAEGKLNFFATIDRTSKFARLRLEKRAGKMEAAQFLRDLLQAPPYWIHTVLTDNGLQFTTRALDAHAFAHILDRVCSENGIEHRLTKVRHPWTNGQVERMNRTIKEATVKRFHDDDHGQRRDISRISSTRIAEVARFV